MEFQNFPAHNKDIPSNMEIIPNSLKFLNSVDENNGADFKAQLEDIDEELAKFDHVEVLRGASAISLSNRNSEQVEEYDTNGLALFGPNNYKNATYEEVKPKTRGS